MRASRHLPAVVLLVMACSSGVETTAPRLEQVQGIVPVPLGTNLALSAPAGLAGCWSGEGNARDITNGHDGAVVGAVSFAPGKFGQAFRFDNLGGDVQVPASPALNVGAGDGYTFSAWIFPVGNMFGPASGAGPILEFEHGAQLWQHLQFGDPYTGLFANLAESDVTFHIHQVGGTGIVTANQWNHAAVTYSRSSGTVTIYSNGVGHALPGVGSFTANTTSMLHIGARVPGSFGNVQFTFNGLIDEVQVYDRALSAAEVASLAAATSTLCVPPPSSLAITTAPVGAVSGALLGTQPVIALRDASNAIAASATNPVSVAIATGPGSLSGTTTVSAVAGVATFPDLRITGAGTTTLIFTSPGLASGTSAPVTTTAPSPVVPASKLAVSAQPGGAESGVALTTQPVVEVRDAANALVPGSSASVTASIAWGSGALSGTTTVNAVNGVAKFTNLKISGRGSHTLRFSSNGLTSALSNEFNVAQVARSLVVTTQPGNSKSGSKIEPVPAVELRDAAGLRVVTGSSAVTATIATGGGALSGTLSVNASEGVAKFTNLVVTGSGTHTFRFALAAGSPSVVSASFSVLAPEPVHYEWKGFYEPVDNAPKVNKANRGQDISLKFSLGGNKGMHIFADAFPAWQQASCSSWSPIGAPQPLKLRLHEHAHGGEHRNDGHAHENGWHQRDDDESSLSYDDGRYTLSWNTERSWAGTCRVLTIRLADGSVHSARFSFNH